MQFPAAVHGINRTDELESLNSSDEGIELAKIAIGARVRRLREERGLTQKQLADLVGAQQTAISKLELRPNTEPGAFLLYRIAKALGTTADALLEGLTPEPKPAPKPLDSDEVKELLRRLVLSQNELTKRIIVLEHSVSSDKRGIKR